MKKISVFLTGIALMGVVAGCSNNIQGSTENLTDTSENKITQVNTQVKNLSQDKKIITTVNSNADMKVNYDTLEKLINASEIVVQGKVIETNSYFQGPGVVTEYKLEISDSYYGEFKAGSIINLISAGGVVLYTEAEEKLNIPKKDFEKGLSESEKKNGYLKFVFNGSVGIYQGQFNLNNNEVSQYNPNVESKVKKWGKDKFISEVKEKVQLKLTK